MLQRNRSRVGVPCLLHPSLSLIIEFAIPTPVPTLFYSFFLLFSPRISMLHIKLVFYND